jgi:hypothetical protein
MTDTITAIRTETEDRLTSLHDAAAAVRVAWERLALVRDEDANPPASENADPAADSGDARRYIAALWQVQAAEEDYLRLREQLLGA